MVSPSQISIFPATSSVASHVIGILQKEHPHLCLRLAARSPEKLKANGNTLKVAQTPLSIDNVSSIKDALEGSDAAFILHPPLHLAGDPFALSKTFVDTIIEAANTSKTLKRIVYLTSIAAETQYKRNTVPCALEARSVQMSLSFFLSVRHHQSTTVARSSSTMSAI
ncbi:uncharacterized protein UDID_08056 [Ustilago sp. UG-2017a]|nr:uncharacterized protein UDID_08056 [Ustilago sp. UG-2017a]